MKGEFELISHIKSMFPLPEGIVGIGDDCAVIPQGGGDDLLVSTDLLVDGTHFLADDIPPRDLGWKSAAVNYSDIAAMGGNPLGSFLSIALPSSVSEEWMDEFMDGYRQMSDSVGAPLLGGDTTKATDKLCINVTVLGTCAHGKAVLRSGARTGDLICVSGNLGDSAAGLKAILSGAPRTGTAAELVRRHYHPVPRVAEGKALAAAGAHSMMDISDGIGSDLRHILEESSKGAVIYTGRIPVSPELQAFCLEQGLDHLELAINGGEDYELLFTIGSADEKKLQLRHFVIGRIVAEDGIRCEGPAKEFKGFRHF